MKVSLNSKEIEIPEKQTIMDVLKEKKMHIPGICNVAELDPYGACRLCLVDVNNRLVTACSTYPKEKDSITSLNSNLLSFRKTALELMLSDHTGDCIGPCKKGCSANSDVQGYLALIGMGKYHEAVALMKENYILPASLGRVCPAFCEIECRRNLIEEPLSIRLLKRFAADYDLAHGPWMPIIPKEIDKKIAIVGGGPAGLACAYYLRIHGYKVTIFEAMPKLGGMCQYGIPSYRLPKDVLEKDIDTVIKTGVEVKTNSILGKNIELKDLQKNYDAVYLAFGAWKSRPPEWEGFDLPGVIEAIDFLEKINSGKKVELGQTVLVIGGGNTAVDAARTARRLGADVSISYRRSKEEMPAQKKEIEEAEEEGIKLNILTNPVKIKGDKKVDEIELVKMKLGEPDESGRRKPIVCEGSNYCIDIDNVILAVGQVTNTELMNKIGLEHIKGNVKYNKISFESNIPSVFVGGDLALGPSTVIQSIDTGRKAAFMIDQYIQGKLAHVKLVIEKPWEYLEELTNNMELKSMVEEFTPYNHWKTPTKEDFKDYERIPKAKGVLIPAKKRITNFEEVELPLKPEQIVTEAKRCLSCGCLDVFECKLRDYSMLYGAKQEFWKGEVASNPIDKSHPYVLLDNNKCILCGQCVNLTHRITGEGLIDHLKRGFDTLNGPPMGMKLGNVNGHFIGSFVDFCPTGAFSFNLPFIKPGPWKTEKVDTICNGCSLGCEMLVELYKGFPVNVIAAEKSWNKGLICDRSRFERMWEEANDKHYLKDTKGFEEITMIEAKNIITKHKSNLTIVLAPDVTNEEAKEIMTFAQKQNMKVVALYQPGVSNAKLSDLEACKKIKLDVSLNEFPLLKPFIFSAKKNGAIISNGNYDLVIVNAPIKTEKGATIVIHKGLNEVGLMNLGLENKIPKTKNYLLIGTTNEKLSGFTISIGKNENADLVLPYPAWISRRGTIINFEGRELKAKKVIEGLSFLKILKTYF